MVVRKCDFCGAEGAVEMKIPQPNSIGAKGGRGGEDVVISFRTPGFHYETLDVCPNCQEDLFSCIQALKENRRPRT